MVVKLFYLHKISISHNFCVCVCVSLCFSNSLLLPSYASRKIKFAHYIWAISFMRHVDCPQRHRSSIEMKPKTSTKRFVASPYISKEAQAQHNQWKRLKTFFMLFMSSAIQCCIQYCWYFHFFFFHLSAKCEI